jgi:tetratricopeptide (TPR) repeat protein
MRITPVLIVEIVVALVILICAITSWTGGSHQRASYDHWQAAREAQLRGQANHAFGSMEEFLKLNPKEVDVRMQLALHYLDATKWKEGQRHLTNIISSNAVAADGGKRKHTLACAEMSMGMLAGRKAVATKDLKVRAEAFAKAKKHFLKAIEIEDPTGLDVAASPEKSKEKEETETDDDLEDGDVKKSISRKRKLVAYGDAQAGLGLIALWEDRMDDARVRFLEALNEKKSTLGRAVFKELHNGLGITLAAQGNMNGARAQFLTAANYSKVLYGKEWKIPGKNLEILKRLKVDEPDMPAKTRKALLAQVAKSAGKKATFSVLNLLGCGYSKLGDMKSAQKYLLAAVKKEPGNALGLMNLLAVRWQVFVSAREKLEKTKKQLYPYVEKDLVSYEWITPLQKQHVKPKHKPEALKPYYNEIALLNTVRGNLYSSVCGVLDGVENIEPNLEKELSLLKVELMGEVARTWIRSKKPKTKAKGRELAKELVAEREKVLKKYAQDYRCSRARIVDLQKGVDVVALLKEVAVCLKLKPGQKDLLAIQAAYSNPPEVSGFYPRKPPVSTLKSVLARSSKPLLGVLFRPRSGSLPLSAEKISVRLDGQELMGSVWGSEFLFFVENKLSDGPHQVVASCEDSFGRKAQAKSSFLVDDSPPDITKTEPVDGGKIKSSRPLLVVHYSDKYSGIDPSSVDVEIRSGRGATTWLVEVPVRGGKQMFDNPKLGIKIGDVVGAGEVKFSSSRNLGVGTYKVTITVGDVRGMKVTKVWRFTIVK